MTAAFTELRAAEVSVQQSCALTGISARPTTGAPTRRRPSTVRGYRANHRPRR
ncbi:hypothetical protein [Kibdelosporangium philippinense]|uniref:hypothetical protein n=1 Tax=Kibdelosporangium philippinense TaxID=211113 RepID=UPI00361FACFE